MMHINFYRKYRPDYFYDVIGQNNIITVLSQQILHQNINHAYLFSGMQGVGKTSTARIFAKTINCLKVQPNGERCRKCLWCSQIQTNTLDIYEIDAASNNGVEQIRNLKENAVLSPVTGNYKIYIIDEIHMLSRSAFNAFLKILEEPPKHVVFILATTEIGKIPATILSRCQNFNFVALRTAQLLILLRKISDNEKILINTQALTFIATSTNGAVREALNLLEQINSLYLTDQEITETDVKKFLGTLQTSQLQSLLEAVLAQKIDHLWTQIQDWNHNNVDFVKLTELLIVFCHQLLKQAHHNLLTFYQTYPYFQDWTLAELNALQQIAYQALQALSWFRFGTQPQVVFEHLILNLFGQQPLIPLHAQKKYLQVILNNDVPKKAYFQKRQPALHKLFLLSQSTSLKILAATKTTLLLVIDQKLAIKLPIEQPAWKVFCKKHQLETVYVVTSAERNFLKKRYLQNY